MLLKFMITHAKIFALLIVIQAVLLVQEVFYQFLGLNNQCLSCNNTKQLIDQSCIDP